MDEPIKVEALTAQDVAADLAGLIDGTSVGNIMYLAETEPGFVYVTAHDDNRGQRRFELTVREAD